MESESKLAQEHIDSIHRLVGHLLERCGDQFDAEMQSFVAAIFTTFDEFRGMPVKRREELDELRTDDALGRNFQIAQSAILMAFFNELEQSLGSQPLVGVRPLIEGTRIKLLHNRELFFPLDWPSRR